ncbi:DUF2441 domain-containing protein [Salmonella enterica subsp. enterica serovar Llandoff]|nr:DUF2441 domain-containing protein [Salmonella enterica subsp. enterica serovar Llandoff]ECO4188314.1 DUF2441 domain-containing protein [Salmonella enterica]
MTKYYTVDLVKGLRPFCRIILGGYTPKQPEQAAFLNNLFPAGLSRHGYNYLYNPGPMMNSSDGVSRSLGTGLIFELVRRSHFPEKPSRYQSLFACQYIDEVKQFRNQRADEDGDDEKKAAPIYEVITSLDVHRGDMNLLDTECPVLELYRRAYLYWSGESFPLYEGYEPFWEILIPLPVQIGARVVE